jgi:hypothetical protein
MKLSASQVKSAKPAEKSYKLSDARGVDLINRGLKILVSEMVLNFA